MKYGIYITKQVFDVFEDGSENLVNTKAGWLGDYEYDMKSAKYRLESKKESLSEEYYNIKVVNSRTIKGVRESSYRGEQFAPAKLREVITLHIEKK